MQASPARWRLWTLPGATLEPASQDALWRLLFYFALYRLAVAAVFIATVAVFGNELVFGSHDLRLFVVAGVAYFAAAAAAVALARMRRPRLDWQLALQLISDIALIPVLMHASGGIASGVGLLLLSSLAAGGLISRGRLILFFAALASFAVLLEQTYAVLREDVATAQYIQAGLLSIGYFATALLAYALAKYALASERLALQRGIDLANLAQVNQLVIQDMLDGVLVVDEQGRVRQHNAQAARLLQPGAPGGRQPLLRDYAPALDERFRAWVSGSVQDFDLLRIPDANRLLRTRYVAVGGDRRHGAVIFLEDMSRVQAQAQQLKLAALGRLTANIAHEIRNPLAAISHASELLQEEDAGAGGARRLVEIIRDNTYRLDRLVQEVLQVNRRDRGNPERFAAAPFLREFVAAFCENEKVPPACFALEAEGDATVCFDRGHLNQVLWNLCRNAWQHCARREGSVRVRVAPGVTANTTRIEVLDDGPGIPAELRNQVFEPFFTTAASGTGLGLYIAREMCDANGASLDFLGAGGGTCFRVTCMKNHVKAQRASDAIGS